LLLDEIGDMPLETQAKILRVLQERTFERVGGIAKIEVDVRVVAATHRDLEAEVKAGRFRQDLYYRLKVVQLSLPALRERLEDLPALAERFLLQLSERLHRPRQHLSEAALARLSRHPFAGNVRELRNLVEQAAVLTSGEVIEATDLVLGGEPELHDRRVTAAYIPGTSFVDAKRSAVEAFERAFLREALRAHDGNVSKTAEAIGMVRQSLQQKMRDLGLREETQG
jgi:two-component system nitrogen regulation response regulator NtrX